MDTQKTEEKGNKKLHTIYLTVIALLLGLCAVLFWQYSEQKTLASKTTIQVVQEMKQKEDVKKELQDLQQEYAQLQTSDAELSKKLDEQRAHINELIEQAEKHKNDASIIAALRRETETLRKIMKGYIKQIDSLATLNNDLRVAKQGVENDLSLEKEKGATLLKDKEGLQNRIDRASLLTTLNVKATGVNYSRGGKKESETKKASKSDKIRVTFDVAENKLTKAGPKEMFVRVITPDGRELTKSADNDHMFEFDGAKGFYAAKRSIDYNNAPLSVAIYCPKAKDDDEFIPGKYIIEITADKATIGKTELVLE